MKEMKTKSNSIRESLGSTKANTIINEDEKIEFCNMKECLDKLENQLIKYKINRNAIMVQIDDTKDQLIFDKTILQVN